ncbi:hypothetical protein [Providencia rettgeri]|uniref:hypothetical protein n=1 Tax=Providencia rettgeri TaxID=587 RepID=UPI001BAD0FDC|nr:hypothetical protein [Providencia rettgeri]MBS0861588.1 hypothetical protein [Providencia rettgeri]MBS0875561.1 hypothetical protein [Providencia rettgeri]MBS0922644.1 hypothetical protein [Providencia rettgeri]
MFSGQVHFFYRTDIRGYYEHFPKARLAAWVRARVPETSLGDIIDQYINYSVEVILRTWMWR